MYIDCMIMVMAASEMAEGSSLSLAIAFAIPLTLFRIGSSVGSAVTSVLIGAFGEKKMGIGSSVITVVSFLGMAACVATKNIYLFSALKFVEGVFLESILFSISEGIPYELEDEERRNRKILESQSATQAAILTAIMTAGIISEYLSFTAMYFFCGILALVLIPMSFWILVENNEEEEGINTLKVWKFFFKPRTLLYILFIVLVLSLVYGYDGYIFPLIAENSGLSGMMLSSIGVLISALGYFGEGILALFKGQTPIRAMVLAFTGIGVGFLLVVIKPSVIIAVLALVILTVFGRVIDNYRIVCMIDICDSDGIDDKDIQENYYALEDSFQILHGPVLGGLSEISTGVAVAFLAGLSLIAPRLYQLLQRKKGGHTGTSS